MNREDVAIDVTIQDKHPEQAGGDERAAFEQWEAEQIAFVLRQIGSMDADDIDNDNVDLRFEDASGRDTGCDVSIVDYAEKAASLIEAMLSDRAALAQPSPAQAEQAEAERPEVVDFNPYRYHAEKIRQRADGAASAYEAGRSALGYMEDIAESALIVRNGLDELSAQHERSGAALLRQKHEADTALAWATRHYQSLEKDRDAALARVAEVETMVRMLEEREWAEHVGESELGQRLEAAITTLINEASEFGDMPKDWRVVAKSNCFVLMEGNSVIASLAGPQSELNAARIAGALSKAPPAQAQHSVPDGAADLCRFLAKLYCELDGLRYSTAKLPAEQIADALIFKWPVLQGARNQLNIKRISEQPYDESKLHSAIAAMLAALPGKEGV
ncbi:TPA: hypothetical protein L4W78_005905 [Pseudomonas aeruginosa]|nr:hypothetical protein [Pseudomonas aeruginosa]